MSDINLEELAEFVFKDIRQDKRYKNLEKKYKDIKDPIDLYHKKSKSTLDAERWDYALDSYQNYPFLCNEEYEVNKKDSLIYYKCSGSCNCRIKITADMLTGPEEIIECAKKHELGKSDSLRKFCEVAYTVGNCCPVMKNKGGRRGEKGGVDTCWYKLEHFLDVHKEYPAIEEAFCSHGVINDLNARDANNMFAMFSDKVKGEEIIKRLMLEDYYNNGSLNKELGVPSEIREDKYEEFLILITTLIIKRGIRIYKENNIEGINLDQLTEELLTKKKEELAKSCTS